MTENEGLSSNRRCLHKFVHCRARFRTAVHLSGSPSSSRALDLNQHRCDRRERLTGHATKHWQSLRELRRAGPWASSRGHLAFAILSLLREHIFLRHCRPTVSCIGHLRHVGNQKHHRHQRHLGHLRREPRTSKTPCILGKSVTPCTCQCNGTRDAEHHDTPSQSYCGRGPPLLTVAHTISKQHAEDT